MSQVITLPDEKGLQDFLNAPSLSSLFTIKAKGQKYTFVSLWSPRELGGILILELYADLPSSITTETGVSLWADQSGAGNDFKQTVALDQPATNGLTISFDGIRQFLDGTDNIANFATDTKGEMVIVGKSNSDAFNHMFNFADSSSATDRNGFLYNATGNQYNAQHRDAATTTTFNSTETGENRIILSFSSSGSAYKFFVNGVDQTANISGDDNGDWNAAITPDVFTLGAAFSSSPFFGACDIDAVIYCNDQLTTQERDDLFIFLNSRFAVY